MKRRPLVLPLLLSSLVTHGVSPAQDDARPRPLPAGAEAYTQRQFQLDRSEFWYGALAAEARVGDAFRGSWQEHVEILLRGYARALSGLSLDESGGNKVLSAIDKLKELECDDPVVLLAIADVHLHEDRIDGARPWFHRAAERFQARAASLLLRYCLQDGLRRFYLRDKQEEECRAATAQACDLLVELAVAPEFGEGRERIYLGLLWHLVGDEITQEHLALLDRIEKRAGKPIYATLVMRGEHHNDVAWAARGQGLASSIGERDAETMAKNFAAAADLFRRAHRLCPKHPEAPTGMVKVIGPMGSDRDELRHWFDLAVAAQFDFLEAYQQFLHYSQPRWGGSARALFDFGRECVATGRFDTDVPNQFRRAVHYITLDSDTPIAYWARKPVQEVLTKLDADCLAAARSPLETKRANTWRVLDLALGGKAAEAAALCEEMGRSLDPAALEVYGVSIDWLKKTLRPHFKDYQPAAVARTAMFAGYETVDLAKGRPSRALSTRTAVPTAKQFEAKFGPWLDGVFADAYAQNGKHAAPWDADAKELLAHLGTHIVAKSQVQLPALAEKLLAAKCDDPLVQYAIVRVLDGKNDARNVKLLGSLMKPLSRAYPASFLMWAQVHFGNVATRLGREDVAQTWFQSSRGLRVTAAADALFQGEGRRRYLSDAWGSFDFFVKGFDLMSDEMVEGIAATKGVDPWLAHVVPGLHHACKARFPKSGAERRAADLRLASEHLLAAYRLAPELPEAAVGMIVVAALGGDAGGATAREWFERAVDREFDYAPAYAAYSDSLRPGFGGSVKAMYRFAKECLDTGRFDTGVPLWYARTLKRIQQETSTPRVVWAANGVAEGLATMFQGYLAQKDPQKPAAHHESGICITAWAGGRYGEALAAWQKLGGALDTDWCDLVGVEDPDVVEFDLKFLEAHREK